MNDIRDSQSASALDLDVLMEKIRAEVSERKRAAAAPVPREPAPAASPGGANRKWTARALLALPAADFARAAHLAFFGREPSADEFVRLRDRLLVERVGRMRVLRELRRSPEARAQQQPIEGLTRAFAWDRIYWSPPAKLGRAVGRGVRNIWLVRRNFRVFVGRIDTLERRAAEITAALRNVQSAQMNDRQNMIRHIRQVQEMAEADRQAAAETKHRLASALNETKSRLGEVDARLADHWRGIVEHKRGLENLATGLQPGSCADDDDDAARKLARETAHALDPLYLSFEDRYRGTRAEIKERQRVYLARVEAACATTGRAPVVDIGCGRGEWLELLAEAGIPARGYDLNRIAVEECRERGLEAELADVLEALTSLPAESCTAVTGFHVIEHLAFDMLVKLVDEALRVLRPGGLLIVETPNPANLLVAAERFYLDPTHRNPLPAELTEYLIRSRGFRDTEIVPLHPVPMEPELHYSDPMLELLRQKLYGAQDYGAIGRKIA